LKGRAPNRIAEEDASKMVEPSAGVASAACTADEDVALGGSPDVDADGTSPAATVALLMAMAFLPLAATRWLLVKQSRLAHLVALGLILLEPKTLFFPSTPQQVV